jgi:hypothetical protein
MAGLVLTFPRMSHRPLAAVPLQALQANLPPCLCRKGSIWHLRECSPSWTPNCGKSLPSCGANLASGRIQRSSTDVRIQRACPSGTCSKPTKTRIPRHSRNWRSQWPQSNKQQHTTPLLVRLMIVSSSAKLRPHPSHCRSHCYCSLLFTSSGRVYNAATCSVQTRTVQFRVRDTTF